MHPIFTVYSLLFLVTALVSFFVAFLAWQRRFVKGAKALTLLMIAAGIGALGLIFETAAPHPADKIFWAKFEFIGGIATPALYLTFVLRFTGKDKFLSPKYLVLLFSVPVITLLLTLTNEKHHLIWSGFSAISEKTNLMEYYHGIGFWLGYIVYSYLVLFLSVVFLIRFIIRQRNPFLTQGLIVLAGGLCPWITSLLYLSGNNPVTGLDITPISITLSGVLAAYAILNISFLNLIPVARETLVETLPDGIIVLDGKNRILDINEAARSFLGIQNKSIIGFPADSPGLAEPQLLKAITDRETGDQTREVSNSSGVKTFRILKHAIKNHSESRLIVIRDISEQRQAECALIKAKEQAEESDRLKSSFLANMSHEIRTPMNGILGFADLLKEPGLPEESTQLYVSIIESSGIRLLNIINDLIDISKIESGNMNVHLSETNINKQTKFIYNFFRPEAEKKGLTLLANNSLPTAEAFVLTDREKLYAILTNLVKNAIKFTSSGFVELGYQYSPSSPGQLLFYVKDTGTGIAPELKKVIFERFRQGSESYKRKHEGAGLGLAISKAYVEMLGGQIWIDTNTEVGSIFYFTLPYHPVPEKKEHPELQQACC
ncbi:MAG: PAS domain-containing protein [Prolixibacteraceae bacterium]|nr:PAS domain-containing protein [Prolixibacteraceae bacterium]